MVSNRRGCTENCRCQMSLCSITQAMAMLQGGQRAQPPTLNKIIKKSTGKKQGVCLHCDKSGGEIYVSGHLQLFLI